MITLLSDREAHQLASYVTEITTALDNITYIIAGAQTVQLETPAPVKSVLPQADKPQSQTKSRKSRRKSRASLTEKKVLEIKRRLAAGEKAGAISQLYKVHVTTINAIKYGKTWGHVQLQQTEA
ncbi:MAG: hypothetical protein ACO4AV_10960 [bacterium]